MLAAPIGMQYRGRMTERMGWREVLLGFVSVAVIVGIASLGAIPQDPNYHVFSDQRTYVGLPNFLNVFSNVPFLVFGYLGWKLVQSDNAMVTAATRPAWDIFFVGIALTAFGSGYFHWQPNNATLIWDRLPMTIGFMSLVSIVVAEYFDEDLGKKLLIPLLVIGVASVAFWAYTESIGKGDLRPYVIVQFLPILLIPLVISLYRERSDLGPYVWWMIGFYILAKVFEHFDSQIFGVGHAISGHSLKHIAASLAPASLIYGLMRRRDSGV